VPEGRLDLSYVLPLRWKENRGLEDLAAYLARIATELTEVVVVDGSPPEVFARNRATLAGFCRHIPPDPEHRFLMGKVDGVTTGVVSARSDRVVIADDDVRYDRASLERLASQLDRAELVRPQNYFDPLPWHARWDTSRTLLNRVFTGDLEFPQGDFPGTLGVRRGFFERMGGYDGDVMFENLQLMRTVRAAGGTVTTPLDLYVARRPPDGEHFLSQRVRQAYDDFAIPMRMAAFLAVGPAALTALAAGRRRELAIAGLAVIGVAELGRRRAGGARVYPLSGALLSPAWVAERAICAWLAVRARRGGGIPYAGSVIPRSGDSFRLLRRRYIERSDSGSLPDLNPTSL
jgi:hypothetical protein